MVIFWKTIPTHLGHGLKFQELTSSLLDSSINKAEPWESRAGGRELLEVGFSLPHVLVIILLLWIDTVIKKAQGNS